MAKNPLSRLDLNSLLIFEVLMQERHVTRTAERLHLSQSTISHALGRLREAVDDPLFVVSRRQLLPTERAKSFALAVRSALAILEQDMRRADGFDPLVAERIFRIVAPGAVEYGLLATLEDRLQRLAPNCCLEVQELSERSYHDELARGAIDLLLTFENVDCHTRQLDTEYWFSNDLVCLTPLESNYPEQLTPEHIVTKPHINTSSWGHSQAMVERWLNEHGLTRKIGVRVPTFSAVAQIMASERYLVVLPEMVARYLCTHHPLQQHTLLPQLSVNFLLVNHPLTRQDPAIKWFKEQLHQIVKKVSE